MFRILHWAFNRFLEFVVPIVVTLTLIFYFPASTYLKKFRNVFQSSKYYFPKDKVVLITGASSGIGEHLAYEYAKRGARLMLVARREDKLRQVAIQCSELGSPSTSICKADLSNREGCEHAVNETITKFDRLDILVLNAGLTIFSPFENLKLPSVMEDQMNVNFWGYIWTATFALPHLVRSHGQILANSSICSFMPTPNISLYNASKAAVLQFFDTVRNEPVGSNVKITLVLPGAIESEMTTGKSMDEKGNVQISSDNRDAILSFQPVVDTEYCARTMVNAACHGEPYLVIPRFWNYIALTRILAPELINFLFWITPKKGSRLNAFVMDTLGLRRVLYD